jgi:hypothetical protein
MDREIPITLSQYLAADQILKEEPTARVASLQVEEEFLRVYLVIHDYETHSETWLIQETKMVEERPYMKHNFWRDREGKWWATYHFFHHTAKEAQDWIGQYAKDYINVPGLYKIKYIWLGEVDEDTR